MPRLHSILRFGCIVMLPIAIPLALGGCAGALVIGGIAAAAGGGYAAGQERGINGAAGDLEIKGNIEKGLIAANPQVQAGIDTTVYEGRVLLTGRVADPQMKATAEQIAGRTANVRAVYNEIEVAPPEGSWNDAKDAWITTRVRSEMVLDPAIRSINYTIDTTNGSVYLIGSARSQAELDRATQIARYVPGVRRVVSYVDLRAGAPVAAMPAAPPPAAGPGPAPAPQGPIQVQRL